MVKFLSLVFFALHLSSACLATEIFCGYISQEVEGTWLEVPYQRDDGGTSHIAHDLQGEMVEFLEQGDHVCVEAELVRISGKRRPTLLVSKILQ